MPPWNNAKLRPPLKMHGGKFYQHRDIIGDFPNVPIEMFVDTCVGGGSVPLNINRSHPNWAQTEFVLNDIDVRKINLLQMIQAEPKALQNRLRAIPYDQKSFDDLLRWNQYISKDPDHNTRSSSLDSAARFMALQSMSRGGMGKTMAWSDRLRGGQPGDLNAWITKIELVPSWSRQLYGMKFLIGDVVTLLQQPLFNRKGVLVYIDTPYYPSTRVSKKAYGLQEMSAETHHKLLKVVTASRANILICGYACQPYREALAGWSVSTTTIANHSSQAETKKMKTEVKWRNYA